MQDWAIWLVLPSRLWEYICMTLKLKLFFSHSVVSDSLWPHGLYPGRFVSMGLISGEEYQSELTFPSPGDLRDLGIEPMSPAWQVDSLPLSHQGRAKLLTGWYKVLSSFFPQHRDIQGCVLLCSPYKLELPSALLPQRLCGAEHTTHSHWIYNKSKKLSLVALFHWSFGVKFLLKFRLALLWIVRISFSSFANSHILRKKSPDHLKYTHTHTQMLNRLNIKDMQMKTTMRYQLTSVKMLIIKKNINKYWAGCIEKVTLVHVIGKVNWCSSYLKQYKVP